MFTQNKTEHRVTDPRLGCLHEAEMMVDNTEKREYDNEIEVIATVTPSLVHPMPRLPLVHSIRNSTYTVPRGESL